MWELENTQGRHTSGSCGEVITLQQQRSCRCKRDVVDLYYPLEIFRRIYWSHQWSQTPVCSSHGDRDSLPYPSDSSRHISLIIHNWVFDMQFVLCWIDGGNINCFKCKGFTKEHKQSCNWFLRWQCDCCYLNVTSDQWPVTSEIPLILALPRGKWLTVAWVLKYLGRPVGALFILSRVHVGASLGCKKSDAVASSHGTVSP